MKEAPDGNPKLLKQRHAFREVFYSALVLQILRYSEYITAQIRSITRDILASSIPVFLFLSQPLGLTKRGYYFERFFIFLFFE